VDGLASLGPTVSVWAHPDDETYLAGGAYAHRGEFAADQIAQVFDEVQPQTVLTFGPDGFVLHAVASECFAPAPALDPDSAETLVA